MKHILITGGAGFIGSHLIDLLLAENNWQVTCVDNFDSFYDAAIKKNNISKHFNNPKFLLIQEDIRNFSALREKMTGTYDVIAHLAAKAGVRGSLADPLTYEQVNVQGTINLLELARQWQVKQFVFASSSSVYGVNEKVPWSEDNYALKPISPYAATKVAAEFMGHIYSYLYGMRFIALRFFTVYGPRQRPDLAIHTFARLMLEGKPIPLFGNGSAQRDYTYVADVVQAVRAALDYDKTLYEIINIGNNVTIPLYHLVELIEQRLKIRAKIEHLLEQPGDVPNTHACIEKARRLLKYNPHTTIDKGVDCFCQWLVGKDDKDGTALFEKQ